MDMYKKSVKDLPEPLKSRIRVFKDFEVLNKFYAADFCDELEKKQDAGKMLNVICPVGPVDYRYFAAEVNKRGLSCKNVRFINMDEYIGNDGELIPENHPLSFRRFMKEQFHNHVPEERAVLPENRVFPDPAAPQKITELIDEIGGADIVWCGMGITGHVAFNDPPAMLGEPDDLESFRNCKTRVVTTSPMSNAQMAMGGTNGVHEIIPPTAVTIGVYELYKTKKFCWTFMRNWHAGLWRKALFGPITQNFPGSIMQDHPNLYMNLTEIAAAVPLCDTQQATGEKK